MADKKNITIYDIAKEVGVSPSMVSRVLSGKGSVGAQTREKIQSVIDKYDFRPNAMARGLQQSRTKMIGFMIPHIGNEYFSNVYYEFEKHASESGYMTIVYNGKSDLGTELKILDAFIEARVEAVVIMGGGADATELNAEYVSAVKRVNDRIPCIICSDQANRLGCVGTHMNIARATELLIEHLREKNYTSLGILGGAPETYPSVMFKKHLRDCAAANGIEIRDEWIHGISYNPEDGEKAMKKLLEQKTLPRVVCCINDYVACGAMSVALDAGLRVPDDIAFTGRDNVEISQIIKPKLTTVANNYEMLGSTLFQMISIRLDGGSASSTLIEPELIVRDST